MDELKQLLEGYEDLIGRYRTIMERELESIKKGGQLDESLVEAKQSIVEELSAKLVILKEQRASAETIDPNIKARLDRVQQTFLQVIKLDRQVEKQFLANQSTASSGLGRGAQTGPDRAAARRLYGLS